MLLDLMDEMAAHEQHWRRGEGAIEDHALSGQVPIPEMLPLYPRRACESLSEVARQAARVSQEAREGVVWVAKPVPTPVPTPAPRRRVRRRSRRPDSPSTARFRRLVRRILAREADERKALTR